MYLPPTTKIAIISPLSGDLSKSAGARPVFGCCIRSAHAGAWVSGDGAIAILVSHLSGFHSALPGVKPLMSRVSSLQTVGYVVVKWSSVLSVTSLSESKPVPWYGTPEGLTSSSIQSS
jgi:hypothetical protein